MKYQITKQAWESIGKQAGWMRSGQEPKEFQGSRWFEWDDSINGSGTWDIVYRDINPDELYDENGRSLSEKEIMKKMIISIQHKFGDEKLSPTQIEYFLDKLSLDEDFFDLVQKSNQLFRDEQRI